MQPRLPTCDNTPNGLIEQAIPSLEDSFITRRFPAFRGITAGPLR
jgi:phosphoribulokinase